MNFGGPGTEYYRMNGALSNSYVKTPMPSVMVFGTGAFGR